MSVRSHEDPRFTVVSDGPLYGRTYSLRRGAQLLGRGDAADVILPSQHVSQRHAYVSWDEAGVTIADARSTNGTSVNGVPLSGPRILEPGDVVQVADLMLRFDPSRADEALAPRASTGGHWSNQFGRDNYGDVHQAGRDVNVQSWHDHRYGEYHPSDELFQGRGPGRVLMGVGSVIALAGFAGWMWLILGVGSDPESDPFAMQLFGLPAGLVFFGAFLLGGVLAGVGGSMSKAAREREREQERRHWAAAHRR